MSRLSIRGRVTLVATFAVAVVLVLAALALLAALRVSLSNRLEAELRNDVRVIEARSLDGRRVPSTATAGRIVQVVDADGQVVWGSDAAGGDDAEPLLGSPLPFAAGSGSHQLSVDDPALGELRVLAVPFGPADEQWLVVARSDTLVTTGGRAVVRALLVGVPALVVGLGLVVYLGVGRALRPVDDIRDSVARITDRRLAGRVPVPGTGDEIDRLARTMNEMLDRLDAASARERRFVADVSHELRGPVASLRALLETRAASPDPSAHDAEVMASLSRVQSLVDQLLVLAAQDVEAPPPPRSVDLDDLVMERAEVLRATSSLTVDTTAVSGGQLVGSEEGLRRMVDNLVANAGRHALSTVRLQVREVIGWVQLVVSDDGPGIDEVHRTVVFEPFARLDEARAADRGGAGLGLSIVAGVVDQHRGRIQVDRDPDLGGARFVVDLPATPLVA
jgi:signal transduction histidine kinase